MRKPLAISDLTAVPGSKASGYLPVPGTDFVLPVTLVNGADDGPVFLLTAGVHGDEYPGIVAASRLALQLDPKAMHGAVVIAHAANFQGFQRRSRNLEAADSGNLNGAFPGAPDGSPTEKLAHFIAKHLHAAADFHVDLHAGSIDTDLTPHLYFPIECDEAVTARALAMAKCCLAAHLVRSRNTKGSVGCAAKRGIPSLLLERGGRGAWTEQDVADDIADVLRMLRFAGILGGAVEYPDVAQSVESFDLYETPQTACWFPAFRAGDNVRAGDTLGELRDVFGHVCAAPVARRDGVVLYQTATLIAIKGDDLVLVGICDEAK